MITDKIWAENLASQYAPRHDRKVIAMKKLDKRAKRPAAIFSYVFGVESILILLAVMYLFMQSADGEIVRKFLFEITELAKEVTGEYEELIILKQYSDIFETKS